MMSLIALSGGILFYAALARSGRTMAPTPLLSRWNAARIFDIVNVALIRGAGRLTRVLFPLAPAAAVAADPVRRAHRGFPAALFDGLVTR